MKTTILLISTALLALTACKPGQVIQPEGVTATEEISFQPDCHSLSVQSTYKVLLDSKVPEGKALLEADKAVLKYVKHEEDEGELSFSIKRGWIVRTLPIHLRIAPGQLKEFSATGNCEIVSDGPIYADEIEVSATGVSTIDLKNLRARKVEAEATGTSSIILEGVADRLEASATGVSAIDAFRLSCENAETDATGSSQIKVQVYGILSGSCVGVSTISYAGQPTKIAIRNIGVSKVEALP